MCDDGSAMIETQMGKIGDNPRVDEWSRSAFKWGFNSRKNKCSIPARIITR